ncbi:polyprotein [Dougjudy virga-like virus]|nr:polyprotein [Dougjudy virga-like virus]
MLCHEILVSLLTDTLPETAMNFPYGLCYLRIFNDIAGDLELDRLSVVLEAYCTLGYFPSLRKMVQYIRSKHPGGMLTVIPAPTFHSSGVLHVPELSLKMTNLKRFLVDYPSLIDHMVGATKIPDVDPVKLAAVLGIGDLDQLMKVNSNSYFVEGTKENIVSSLLHDRLSKLSVSQAKDVKINIPNNMSTEMQKQLTMAFPTYQINYTNDSASNTHSYAAASRMVENEELLRRAKYRNDAALDPNYDAQVVDIGGHWTTHFARSRHKIHSCSPILDGNDDKRASFRHNSLLLRNSITTTQVELLKENINKADIKDLSTPMFCLKRGEECKVKAPVCMFLHSVYDMTNTQIANCLESHGSRMGVGTFIFVPEILYNTKFTRSGEIPVLRARWTIFSDEKGDECIRFSFVDDCSWNYVHKLEDYISLCIQKVIYSDAGTPYYVELTDNINGIQFFNILRSVVPVKNVTKVYHSLWLKNKDMVRFKYYEFDVKLLHNGYRRLRPMTISARSDVVTAITQYALVTSEAKFNVGELFSYAKSYTQRIIVGGNAITNRHGEYLNDVDSELFKLVQIIFVIVYERKYEMGLVLKSVMDEIKEYRNDRGWFSRIYSRLVEKFKESKSGWSDMMINALFGQWLGKRLAVSYSKMNPEMVFAEWVGGTVPNVGMPNAPVSNHLNETRDTFTVYIRDADLSKNLNGIFAGGNEDEIIDENSNIVSFFSSPKCIEESREKDLILNKVPGDGDCMFHTFGTLFGDKDYRRTLVDRYADLPNDKKPKHLQPGNTDWGDDEVIEFLVKHEKISVCVHNTGSTELAVEDKYRHYRCPDAKHLIHVSYNGSHFDALLYAEQMHMNKVGTINITDGIVPPVSVSSVDLPLIEKLLQEDQMSVSSKYQDCPHMQALKLIRKLVTMSSPILSLLHKPRSNLTEQQLRNLLKAFSSFTYDHNTKYFMINAKPTTTISPRVKQDIDLKILNISNRLGTEISGDYFYKGKVAHMADVLQTMELLLNRTVNRELNVRKLTKKILSNPPSPIKKKDGKIVEERGSTPSGENTIVPSIVVSSRKKNKKSKSSIVSNVESLKVTSLPNDDKSSTITRAKNYAVSHSDDSLISVHTEYSCAVMIQSVREDIDLIPDETYRAVKKSMLRPIPTECINRSQAKLKEILSAHPQLIGSIALDLCSAPGGFVLELALHFESVEYKEYVGGDITMVQQVLDLPNAYSTKFNNGDLTKIEVLNHYLQESSLYDLITADGAIECHVGNPELINLDLLRNECEIGVAKTKEGGSFIVKVFDMLLPETREIIRNTALKFTKFTVFNSQYSSPISGEMYVIFEGRTNLRVLDSNVIKVTIRGIVRQRGKTLYPTLSDFLKRCQAHKPKPNDVKCVKSLDKPVDVVVESLPMKRKSDIIEPDSLESYWRGSAVYRAKWMAFKYAHSHSPKLVYNVNAVIEIWELWRTNVIHIVGAYEKFFSNINLYASGVKSLSDLRSLCQASPENFGVYSVVDRKFIVTPTDNVGNHEYAFDGERFIALEYSGKIMKFNSSAEYLLMGRSSMLMQDARLYDATFTPVMPRYEFKPTELVSGVPGCGKTHFILSKVASKDMIVTTTKENCEDIKARLKIAKSELSASRVRTIHSILINGCRDKVNTLYIDEALMSHCGEIVLVSHKTQCKNMVLVGDVKQIPYICRVAMFTTHFASVDSICSNTSYLSTSYRVPRDVARYYHPKYPQGFSSRNLRDGTVKWIKVTSYNDLPKLPVNTVLLTFKQSEKALLIRRGYPDTKTIHEFQGKQSQNVWVYRESTVLPEPVYSSAPHILVALTRHTESFRYFTRIAGDAICNAIDEIRSMSGIKVGGDAFMFISRNFKYDGKDYDHVVSRGLAIDLPRFAMNKKKVKTIMPHFATRKLRNKVASIAALQTWYDESFPGMSIQSQEHDVKLMHDAPLELQISTPFVIDAGKCVNRRARFDTLRNSLRTAVGKERPRTAKELLCAFAKRNDNVPELASTCDVDKVVESMMDLFTTYIDPQKISIYESFRDNPITLNSESIQQWLDGQQKIPPLEERFLNEIDVSTYDFTIKPRPKVDVTENAINTYSALQTIACHQNTLNQMLCPLFRDMKERLLAILDERFKIFTDVSSEEFADLMTESFPAGLGHCKVFEIDMSKYDKSQGELALKFDCEIMRKFGFSNEIIDIWWKAHEVTTLVDRSVNFKTTVVYQRKSGDPFTFLGNTLHLMATLAVAVDMRKIEAGVFAGDDSVLFSEDDIGLESIDILSTVFNLEAKLFKRNFPYFCSKFLIYDEKWYFIPDLAKVVAKLGRMDLRNFDHMKEYYTSMKDLLSVYRNKAIINVLSVAFAERYPSAIDGSGHCLMHIIRHLVALIEDERNFGKLYYTQAGDKLCLDPTRPGLEW